MYHARNGSFTTRTKTQWTHRVGALTRLGNVIVTAAAVSLLNFAFQPIFCFSHATPTKGISPLSPFSYLNYSLSYFISSPRLRDPLASYHYRMKTPTYFLKLIPAIKQKLFQSVTPSNYKSQYSRVMIYLSFYKSFNIRVMILICLEIQIQ